MALHWRYNKKDFGKHCDSQMGWRACPIYNFGHTHTIQFAKLVHDVMKAQKIRKIYIAAPPDQHALIQSISDELTQNHKIIVKTGVDLDREIMQSTYKSCGYIQDKYDDVLSVIEQEICFKSAYFLRSDQSTWSSNIREERDANNIFETMPLSDLLKNYISAIN